MTAPDVTLRNAKPTGKTYRIVVGDNLYLKIMTTGRKIWRMRYRQAGLLIEAHGLDVPPLLTKYVDHELKVFKANNPVSIFELDTTLPRL